MENKFELGPLQKMWLDQLRKYPERQTKVQLGHVYGEDYKACCLGELHLCAYRIRGEKLPFSDGKIVDDVYGLTLDASYALYGLIDDIGSSKKPIEVGVNYFTALAGLNDSGITWPEIADIVENDPSNFFVKSV